MHGMTNLGFWTALPFASHLFVFLDNTLLRSGSTAGPFSA